MTKMNTAIQRVVEAVVLRGEFSIREIELEEEELSSFVEVLYDMERYDWLRKSPADEVTWLPGQKTEILLRLRTHEEHLEID